MANYVASLEKKIKEQDFLVASLLARPPPSLPISSNLALRHDWFAWSDLGFIPERSLVTNPFQFAARVHAAYVDLLHASPLSGPPEIAETPPCELEVDSGLDSESDTEYRDADYTHYLHLRQFTDADDDNVVDPPPRRTPTEISMLDSFRAAVTRLRTPKQRSVTLGMWHHHWQSRPYSDARHGGLTNPCRLIPSIVHPNLRWEVEVVEGEGKRWIMKEAPTQHPDRGGASDSPDYAYAPEEVRPYKQLEVCEFMEVEKLPYVDFELYIHLKEYTMTTGTTASTYQKLCRLAKTYLATYRTNHLHPGLLLEVVHWTVLAALIPTESELRGIQMLGKTKIYKQMKVAAQFKRDGTYEPPKKWYQFRRPTVLAMYKPAPA